MCNRRNEAISHGLRCPLCMHAGHTRHPGRAQGMGCKGWNSSGPIGLCWQDARCCYCAHNRPGAHAGLPGRLGFAPWTRGAAPFLVVVHVHVLLCSPARHGALVYSLYHWCCCREVEYMAREALSWLTFHAPLWRDTYQAMQSRDSVMQLTGGGIAPFLPSAIGAQRGTSYICLCMHACTVKM